MGLYYYMYEGGVNVGSPKTELINTALYITCMSISHLCTLMCLLLKCVFWGSCTVTLHMYFIVTVMLIPQTLETSYFPKNMPEHLINGTDWGGHMTNTPVFLFLQ